MNKNQRLIVKLIAILGCSAMLLTGCGSKEERYDDFMVTNENGTQVLHKADGFTYKFYCGTKAKNETYYENQPEEYAYDIKCGECFPNE